MERPAHLKEDGVHHPPPVPRDPELPALSDAMLMLFAGCALALTAVALFVLL